MKLLIDLSILRHPYCGLGQVAREYGEFLATHPGFFPADCDITLLVPKDWTGRFGNRVNYLVQKDIWRHLPCLMPHFDVWHSIHQLSAFRPWGRMTRRILTIHDVNFYYEKKGAKRERYRKRLQREVDSSAEICFISQFAMHDALRLIDLHSRTPHTVREAVLDSTDAVQQRPDGIPDERPFLLSIGVLKEKKNIHTLLSMMERLPEYNLVIAGGGSGGYADRLRNEAKRHSNVIMTGFVSDAGHNWLLAHCKGLCFPSLFEGFGRPIVEALQRGKPVFCSTSTSIPETAGDHAFYFSDFDPDSMAKVVSDGLRAFTPERAAAAKAYAESFSYEQHMSQYRELYTKR